MNIRQVFPTITATRIPIEALLPYMRGITPNRRIRARLSIFLVSKWRAFRLRNIRA